MFRIFTDDKTQLYFNEFLDQQNGRGPNSRTQCIVVDNDSIIINSSLLQCFDNLFGQKPLGLENLKCFCFTTRSERNGFRSGISHRKAQIYYTGAGCIKT